MQNLLQELKRRNVFRVAAAYIVGGWLLVEIFQVLIEIYEAPGWILKLFVALLLHVSCLQVRALIGERDAVIAELRSHMGEPKYPSRVRLRYHPEWDFLRDDPRFRVLYEASYQSESTTRRNAPFS